MKKLIAVTTSLMLASAAISANAATIKEGKISVSDLLDCVKNSDRAGITAMLTENLEDALKNKLDSKENCPLSTLVGCFIGNDCELPGIEIGSVGGNLSDALDKLLDRLHPEQNEDPAPEEKPGETPEQPDECPEGNCPGECPDGNCPGEYPDSNCPGECPDKPILPEKPEEPTTPTEPEQPSKPEQPTEPEKPSEAQKPAQGDNSGYESESAYVNEVLRLVNQYRNANGLASVKLDSALCGAADVRAKEIRTSFSHTRPSGQSCFTVLAERGISYNGAGENIAYGQSSASEVMTAWMNSEGHRANILNASFTKLGVGVYSNGGTLYWAQMFTY